MLHTLIRTKLTSLSLGCVAAVLLAGCADPKVEQAAKFEREMSELSASYSKTLASNTNLLSMQPSSDSLTSLRAIAEQAKGLSGANAAQQEAVNQLATSVYRTAGSIELAHASRIESTLEISRNFVLQATQVADGLDAIAEVAQGLDFGSARGGPQAAKDAASRASRALQESIQGIERPLGQLTGTIAADSTRVNQLEQESALLLRKARESSPAAGFAFVEESAAIEAEARATRTRISNNELDAAELDSDLTTETINLRGAEAVQAAATNALTFIDTFDGEIDGAAAKSRALATTLRTEASNLLKDIAQERAGALKAAYEAAAADFANANGGLGSDAASNALRNALMCEELRAKSAQIAGLGAHGRMLGMLGSTGASELASVKTDADAAITALKSLCSTANDSMAAVGEDPAYAALKAYIDSVKKSADALSVDTLMAPPVVAAAPKASAKPTAGNSGRSNASSSAGAIADPEAFVAQVAAMEPAAAASAFVGAIDDSTATGKAMKALVQSSLDAIKPLMDAMVSKWGAEGLAALDGLGGGPGGGQGMGAMSPSTMMTLKKESNDGSRAVFKAADGSDIVFVKGSDGWKIDLSEALKGAGMGDEQLEQMAPMMTMMMGQLMKPMKAAAEDIAKKVAAGDFASAADAGAAFQAAVSEGMGKALGGGLGRGLGAGPGGG